MTDDAARERAARRLTGARLGLFYGATFAVTGLYLPYWPVWLEAERDLSAAAIGVLLAALFWPRVVGSLLIARAADHLGERRRLMIGLAGLTLATFVLFGLAESFFALLALSLIAGATFSGILPLGEATALEEARTMGLDYARTRLWGSLTFILAASGGGLVIESFGAGAILPMLLVAMLLMLVACAAVPAGRPAEQRLERVGLGAVLRVRGLWPVLLAAALIQVSHAVYYGFATIHWRAAGLSAIAIGWLWAEAVVAEVVLFAFATRLLGRAGPARVLALAGLLGTLRWAATGLTTGVPALLLIQTLHAATFGLTHLATMRHLQERVPPAALTTAQGLFASLMALSFGVMTPLAGWLYGTIAGDAFLAVALLPLGATLLLSLHRPAGT